MKNKITSAILFLTAGFALAWGITSAILTYIDFIPEPSLLFAIVFLLMVSFRLILLNRYTIIFTTAVMTATLILIFFQAQSNQYLKEIIIDFFNLIKMTFFYITGFESYNPVYETVVTWILSGAVALFVTVFAAIFFRFYILLCFTSMALGVCLFPGSQSFRVAFLACLSGIFIYAVYYLRLKSSDIKSPDFYKRLVALCMIPVVAGCLILSYFIPTPQNDFWDNSVKAIVRKPIDKIHSFFYPVFSPKYFSLSTTGFLGKDSRLGGDAAINDEVIMEIGSNKKLYLAGAYKDLYTGYSWINTMSENEIFAFEDSKLSVDFLELAYSNFALSLDTGEFDSFAEFLDNPERINDSVYSSRCNYIQDGTLTIQIQLGMYAHQNAKVRIKNAKTYSVFYPYLATSILNDNAPVWINRNKAGDIWVDRLMENGSTYDINYRSRAAVSYWVEIINCSRRGIYKEIYDRLQILHEKNKNFKKDQVYVLFDESMDENKTFLHLLKMYPQGEEYYNPSSQLIYEDFLEQQLIPRSEEIYKLYTMLPANFPERVVMLSKDITENEISDYMKARAVEKFLRKFPYTLSPGITPKGRDFVDYFLFDAQKGYCTYFASAFVTMCRAIGLPARYVEGYVTSSDKNENGEFIVTNRQGHAWAEVYFEGYGWYQFEPTPSSDSAGFPQSLPKPEKYKLEKEAVAVNTKKTESIFVVPQEGEWSSSVTGNVYNAETLSQDSQNGNNLLMAPESEKTDITKIVLSNVILSVLFLMVILLIIMLLRIWKYSSKERKAEKKQNNEAVKFYYKKLQSFLVFFQYPVYKEETSIQYASRIGNEFLFCGNTLNIGDIAEIFSRACYGEHQVSSDDKDKLKITLWEMEDMIKKKTGRIKFLYYRYVARIF